MVKIHIDRDFYSDRICFVYPSDGPPPVHFFRTAEVDQETADRIMKVYKAFWELQDELAEMYKTLPTWEDAAKEKEQTNG